MALKFADEMLRGVTSIYRTRKESDNNPGLALPQLRCDLASNSMPCSADQQSLGIEQVSASGNRRLSERLRLKVPKATRSCERKEEVVCYTCGCKLPYEDHGDPANIVEDDLKQAGQTETIKRAGVTAAKLNMLELLQLLEEAGDLKRPKQDYS